MTIPRTAGMMPRQQIVKLASDYHRRYREAEAQWIAEMREHFKPKCKIGCNHCCYQLPLGTLVTGVLIADHLLRMNPQRLQAIKEQGDFQCALFGKHGPDDAAWVYFQQHHQPCALLQQSNGLCSVYALRPPMCSSYYTVTGPELCGEAKFKTKVGSWDNRRLQSMAVTADPSFLATVFADPGWEHDLIIGPLGMMVKAGEALLDRPDKFIEYAGG